jgi:hypothetical protein
VVFKTWFPGWLERNRARIIATADIRLLATGEKSPWYVVELAADQK